MLCRLKDALGSAVDELGISSRLAQVRAVDVWNREIGPSLPTVSYATVVHSGVMHVTCEQAVWAQQLSLLKRDLLRRINARAGQGSISDIRFHCGQVRPCDFEDQSSPTGQYGGYPHFSAGQAGRSRQEPSPTPDWADAPLGPGAFMRAERTSLAIEDPELKERFQALLLSDIKYRSWLRAQLESASPVDELKGSWEVAQVLRREPWLPDRCIREMIAKVTPDDLQRARIVVAEETKEKLAEALAQAELACQSARSAPCAAAEEERKRRATQVRLLSESLAMLVTGVSFDQIDEGMVRRVLGEDLSAAVWRVVI